MNVFKTKAGKNESIELTKENFIKYTKKIEPYFQGVGKDEKHYAVCPLCDNPITIVGLYKNEKGQKLHGRHFKDINGLCAEIATYDEAAYENCPYANPNSKSEVIRPKDNETGRALYDLMRKHFDKVVYILEKTLKLKISLAYAEKLLSFYAANEGWRFYEATYDNLPFFLMYGRGAEPIYKKRILEGSEIYNTLKEDDNVNLVKEIVNETPTGYYIVENKENQFLDYTYILSEHKYVLEDDELTEYFTFDISSGNAAFDTLKDIHKHKIKVDPNYLRNLINYKEWKPNRKLLDIAEKIMG